MPLDTLIDSPEKVQLGMGELFAIIETGVNTPSLNQNWAFLEVQPDTVITSLIFKDAKTNEETVVTRYNKTFLGVCLIPPVYNQRKGYWVSVSCEGQIYVYGDNAIG